MWPGRPSNLSQLTSKGYECFSNGKGSEKFAASLFSCFESALDLRSFEYLLNSQALAKIFSYRSYIGKGALSKRLQKFFELRNYEDHISEFKRCPDNSGSWYLNAFHCSIKSIAEEFSVICKKDLEVIEQILSDCVVESSMEILCKFQ